MAGQRVTTESLTPCASSHQTTQEPVRISAGVHGSADYPSSGCTPDETLWRH